MYIITTGTGEHRGIDTLKKSTNKNVHHYYWHRGAPWHRCPEKMYKQKCTSLQLALGSTVALVPWKNVKTKMYIITTSSVPHPFAPPPPPKKNPISPFFDFSGNKILMLLFRIGQEIRCLPCAGFFFFSFSLKTNTDQKYWGTFLLYQMFTK